MRTKRRLVHRIPRILAVGVHHRHQVVQIPTLVMLDVPSERRLRSWKCAHSWGMRVDSGTLGALGVRISTEQRRRTENAQPFELTAMMDDEDLFPPERERELSAMPASTVDGESQESGCDGSRFSRSNPLPMR